MIKSQMHERLDVSTALLPLHMSKCQNVNFQQQKTEWNYFELKPEPWVYISTRVAESMKKNQSRETLLYHFQWIFRRWFP